jgi:hypothetical protein
MPATTASSQTRPPPRNGPSAALRLLPGSTRRALAPTSRSRATGRRGLGYNAARSGCRSPSSARQRPRPRRAAAGHRRRLHRARAARDVRPRRARSARLGGIPVVASAGSAIAEIVAPDCGALAPDRPGAFTPHPATCWQATSPRRVAPHSRGPKHHLLADLDIAQVSARLRYPLMPDPARCRRAVCGPDRRGFRARSR